METYEPLSVIGLFICFLFVFKGVVAIGLWTEQKWAVDLGIADAVIGIGVCFMMMILPLVNPDFHFAFRLELILLIPFLIKLLNIRGEWKQAGA